MKIDVSDRQLWLLAQHSAKRIHTAVIHMHVRLTGSSDCDHIRQEIRDIRELIRSLPGEGYCSPRRDFVHTVRYLFKQLREESRLEPKWQDHIAKVRLVHPDHITPECEAKLRQIAA